MIWQPFNYSGFASLKDLQSELWLRLFKELEDFQMEFSRCVDSYRSPEYIWPRDPLHTWSRVWEYPYVLYHLRKYQQAMKHKNEVILDLGSGVTFFPFFLAREGFKVIATDIDPVCEKDFKKAIEVMNMSYDQIDFLLGKEDYIPLEDNSIPCVYSISVIEHVKNIPQIIKEIHRVLIPDGLFILTFDVSLNRRCELSPEKFEILLSSLNQCFELVVPLKLVHPLDMLCSNKGPYPLYSQKTVVQKVLHSIKGIAKKIFGFQNVHLACAGYVGKKIFL
jgi:ubiquinone/menaquinone biosynthesis C-methylase UbiE